MQYHGGGAGPGSTGRLGQLGLGVGRTQPSCSPHGLAVAMAFRNSGLYNDEDVRCASVCGARSMHPEEPHVSFNVRELFGKRLALLNGSIWDYLGRSIDPSGLGLGIRNGFP